jgi:NADPH2:quinone reductase
MAPADRVMRAVRLDEVGAPENLKVVSRPVPQPGDDDVLIKVALAGLIYADVEARRGTYSVPTPLPWYPGREVAGTIEQVGKRVRSLRPGDRVAALVLTGGGYAEYALASTRPFVFPGGVRTRAANIVKLPPNLPFSHSLVYLVNFRLAHLLLHAWAKVPKGARVLIHGASGGMGSMLTQLARRRGCEIFATCRSGEQMRYCAAIGADHCIDVTASDYVEVVLALTRGAGVHVSFNGVGGDTVARDPLAVKALGEIHLYGYVTGKPAFAPFDVRKSIALKTFSADDFFGTRHFQAATRAMHAWFEHGPLLDVTRTFRLAEAPSAHRWLEDGRAIGKVALAP